MEKMDDGQRFRAKYALQWKERDGFTDATVGDFEGGNGTRFSIVFQYSCHLRGQWRLLVENRTKYFGWPSFDEQDMPLRYFHDEGHAYGEAQAIAYAMARHFERRAR